jgi:hypothetical protein
MKLFTSIALLLIGLVIFTFYLSGSHGHLRFRPGMLEDWIFFGLMMLCFLVPVLFFISWLNKKG